MTATQVRETAPFTGRSVHLRARYYDPETASFLSVDPLLDLTKSMYGYVNENPLQAIDPLGLTWWKPNTWTPKTWQNINTIGAVLSVATTAVAVSAIVVGTGGVAAPGVVAGLTAASKVAWIGSSAVSVAQTGLVCASGGRGGSCLNSVVGTGLELAVPAGMNKWASYWVDDARRAVQLAGYRKQLLGEFGGWGSGFFTDLMETGRKKGFDCGD